MVFCLGINFVYKSILACCDRLIGSKTEDKTVDMLTIFEERCLSEKIMWQINGLSLVVILYPVSYFFNYVLLPN